MQMLLWQGRKKTKLFYSILQRLLYPIICSKSMDWEENEALFLLSFKLHLISMSPSQAPTWAAYGCVCIHKSPLISARYLIYCADDTWLMNDPISVRLCKSLSRLPKLNKIGAHENPQNPPTEMTETKAT